MSVRRSLSWALACQLVTFVMVFGGSTIIARLLSPTEMGINAIAMAGLGIVQIVATSGLSGYIVRDADLQPRTLDLAFSVNAALAILLATLLFLVSFFSTPLLGDARAGEVLRLLAISPLLNIFSFRASAMLQRDLQFRAFALISSGVTVSTTLLTILFAWQGQSYRSSAEAGVIAALIGAIAYHLAAPHHSALRVTFRGWRALAGFGLQIMSISGVANLAARLADVILGRVLGIAALGIYSRASQMSNLMFENIYGTATRVAFPKLAQDLRETGELKTSFLRTMEMILAVMWPVEIGLAILSGPAIRLLYGERWLGAAWPLALLLVAQSIVLSFGMNWELFVLRGETARQSRLEVLRALGGLVVFAIGCQFGLAGAALGRVGDAAGGYFLYRRHVRRLAHVEGRAVRRLYLSGAVLTVVAVAPSAVLMAACRWAPDTSIAAVFATVVLGVLGWAVTLVLLGHPLVDEAVRIATRLHPRLGLLLARMAGVTQ